MYYTMVTFSGGGGAVKPWWGGEKGIDKWNADLLTATLCDASKVFAGMQNAMAVAMSLGEVGPNELIEDQQWKHKLSGACKSCSVVRWDTLC